MSQENFTFLLDSEKKEALRAIANVTDRDLTYILNEAIASYLEIYQWLLDEINKGVAEAEAGDFASDDEVQAIFAKLTNEN
ncbi:MAG: CopG family transcriptional regulator [Microcoleus sp. PH2017_29_MFU_D_A]|jgi:predicted transcriptional regulator|uniref:CopG family ribbon-helix-helix protein n=1 Tax=unclassified Microcoleus TaxID=2642155 RepID=UPI001E058D8F|nr:MULTISPECIES: CopG family transcriptional regulator [unclassified Microcoleus]MCC3420160.1 CopG family transcriptional regulator [Microcoleus sp. PH2017_07_MST_O_A]MCC3510064.1 CopG family transcriptional regulator [Microcoleus sp. PH2017_17_BER_D_A]TAF90073.1 MAG: CopG family transcriptional regulator [Oscillatoriales cyanobacterium]MCC3424625.1 CopG family transcriptional regulator [Microcoleus sp. PH2017_01_SCD_O_A]MCC3448026.1 CopG family transcriptional regulator [Microcoleus sp. PH201